MEGFEDPAVTVRSVPLESLTRYRVQLSFTLRIKICRSIKHASHRFELLALEFCPSGCGRHCGLIHAWRVTICRCDHLSHRSFDRILGSVCSFSKFPPTSRGVHDHLSFAQVLNARRAKAKITFEIVQDRFVGRENMHLGFAELAVRATIRKVTFDRPAHAPKYLTISLPSHSPTGTETPFPIIL